MRHYFTCPERCPRLPLTVGLNSFNFCKFVFEPSLYFECLCLYLFAMYCSSRVILCILCVTLFNLWLEVWVAFSYLS